MSVVEGRNPVLEILTHSPEVLRCILLAESLQKDPKTEQILQLSREHKICVEQRPKTELDRISVTGHHQGIIALTNPPKYIPLREILERGKQDLCLILLAEVQDPHNLGAILRTAEATDADAIVISKRRSVGLTPAVHRVSMGGSSAVPLVKENLYSVLKILKEEGIKTIGVDADGPVDYFDENLDGPIALVVGGEDKGLNASLIAKCDRVVRIPMKGRLGSLNVGVATAVVLYERMRQQENKRRSNNRDASSKRISDQVN